MILPSPATAGAFSILALLACAVPVPAGEIRLAAGDAADPMAGGGYDPLAASGGYNPMAPAGGYDPLARTPSRPGGDDAGVELAPEFGNLPKGDGAVLVYTLCSGCHGLDIVKQQRMTDERWHYTLKWMTEEQGMAPLPPALEEQVLSYLTTHFSSTR